MFKDPLFNTSDVSALAINDKSVINDFVMSNFLTRGGGGEGRVMEKGTNAGPENSPFMYTSVFIRVFHFCKQYKMTVIYSFMRKNFIAQVVDHNTSIMEVMQSERKTGKSKHRTHK